MKRNSAFTLAEVLITLVIIGVIAAMTIPSLLNNTNKQEYRTALKKAVSALNQAVTMQYALEGSTAAEFTDADDLRDNLFAQRLNVVSTSMPGSSGAYQGSADAGFYTADGIFYGIEGYTSTCSDTVPCATIRVDVNGDRKPNTLTDNASSPKDGFMLSLYPQRVTASTNSEATQKVLYDAAN
ncbi:MAG: type II secretion system protein [Candidatus Gastranaerophilales bacterium]|nr:type II secretion system protein [Candidatus Gastranaerophilales bacterium]